jgi:anti-sigma B factor antagonist
MCFEIRHERSGSVPVVAVSGEIDLATADSLRSTLGELPRTTPVVVDLSEMSFIDGSGLRVLLDEHSRRSAHLYVVCAPAGPLPRILEASGVPQDLRLYTHRESAIWAARSGERYR